MELQPYRDTNHLLSSIPLPDLVLLRQRFPHTRLDDINGTVITALDGAGVQAKIQPGARIAVAVGSRGIANIAAIVQTAVTTLRRYGAKPFIVPAMGSHGGATPEGQRSLLESLGVTAEAMGAPIVSSLAVDQLGTLANGLPVHIDREAHNADGIFVINRIKPHTDFTAPIESGLAKMLAIGLGKHAGALTVHSWGLEGLVEHLPEVAKFVVAHANVLGGLAILENAQDEVAEIVAVAPEDIGNEVEAQLQERAKAMMPRLPWDRLDVLIIDKMGKNISGAGMDPNITGRLRFGEKPNAARVTNLTVHDLTEESHGNAIGIGAADFTTQRLMSKVDFQYVYINMLTAGVISMHAAKVPMICLTDREAIAAAIRSSGRADYTQVQVARIESTLRLEYILASKNSLDSMRPDCNVEVLGEPMPFPIDPRDASLVPFAMLQMSRA
jgi:hypothetical protein